MSYLTESDHAVAMLVHPQDPAPYFTHISQSQLSVARYYGGMQFRGHHYTYMPESDELIRDDVLQAITTARKLREKAARADDQQRAEAAQGELL